MTKGEIENVLKLHPTLTHNGFQNGVRLWSLTDADVDGCTRCERWLEPREQSATIDYDVDSYTLKHAAEAEVGYVTNGHFIVAAIHLGFKMQRDTGTPNAFFNVGGVRIDTAIFDAEILRLADAPARDDSGTLTTRRGLLRQRVEAQAKGIDLIRNVRCRPVAWARRLIAMSGSARS